MQRFSQGFFAVLTDIFVAISFAFIMHIMSKRAANGFAKLIGIIGATLLIISVGYMILARTEIGATAMTSIQDIGRPE